MGTLPPSRHRLGSRGIFEIVLISMGIAMNVEQFSLKGYAGYETRLSEYPDEELTQVGPETPGGEYLRRFWHPVYLTMISVIYLLPLKFLAKNWFCFETSPGTLGLVHKRCPHRQASLEYGKCEEHGSVVVITAGTSTPTVSCLTHLGNQKILVIV